MPKFTFEPRLRWKNYLPPPKSDHYEWNVALSSNKSDVSDEKQRVASHVCMLLTAKVKVHSQTVVSTIKHLKTGNRNRHSLSINPTEVITPNEIQRDEIHRVIYEELVRGIIKSSSRSYFMDVISEFTELGVEGVIAGCTEIELLVRPEELGVAYFPTTSLHSAAAAEFALS